MQGHRREEQQAFIAFRSHYLFESRFCTPGEGHEKGLVENLAAPALHGRTGQGLAARLLPGHAHPCRCSSTVGSGQDAFLCTRRRVPIRPSRLLHRLCTRDAPLPIAEVPIHVQLGVATIPMVGRCSGTITPALQSAFRATCSALPGIGPRHLLSGLADKDHRQSSMRNKVIADVSDQGMPAALFMTLEDGLLFAEARHELS